MDRLDHRMAAALSRRRLLAAAAGGLGAVALPGVGRGVTSDTADLHLIGGSPRRPYTTDFPGKGRMILQRTHPPLLETPLADFRDAFTPNDRFFVRWHWGDLPTSIDVGTYRIAVRGAVRRPLSIGLARLLALPRIELAAVNQCSGNSRGLFQPRVPGAQWGHGAMGNARWLGVSLRHVLDLAGVRADAVAVRFGARDRPLVAGAPDFEKSLAIDHARDGEVMLAFGMNGEQLPLLNGFPVRLVVPGWYSTYWIKTLDDIEVLSAPDDRYWMAKAYKVPDTPLADVAPDARDFPTVPISRMVPRCWITSLGEGERVAFEPSIPIGGIAMGGDAGVARVDVSGDGGRSWRPASLGADHGRYSFRRWDATVPLAAPGRVALMARCTNTAGIVQPMAPNWNPNGFMRANIEVTTIEAVRP